MIEYLPLTSLKDKGGFLEDVSSVFLTVMIQAIVVILIPLQITRKFWDVLNFVLIVLAKGIWILSAQPLTIALTTAEIQSNTLLWYAHLWVNSIGIHYLLVGD